MSTIYLHTECPTTGLQYSVKLSNVRAEDLSEAATIAVPCSSCRLEPTDPEVKHLARRVTEWTYARLTAHGEDCLECEGEIVYLPDLERWVHVAYDQDVLDPGYGAEAGHEPEPSGRMVVVELRTGTMRRVTEVVRDDSDKPPPLPRAGSQEETIRNYPGLRGTVR